MAKEFEGYFFHVFLLALHYSITIARSTIAI